MSEVVQQTICRPIQLRGVGFLTGAEITLRLLPADVDTGICFERIDLPGTPRVPATIEYAVPRQRRTAIQQGSACIEMIEHVMAALAGLGVHNCVVQLDAPEPPGFDGSSRAVAEAILEVGLQPQNADQPVCVVDEIYRVADDAGGSEIVARPVGRPCLAITYHLDYGPRSPIAPQVLSVEITPETFLEELAFARTFLLEEEALALRAQGYGTRIGPRDLLVFGPEGVIDNRLRAPDECARHKILDCIGDFALLGRPVRGHFVAVRSGHGLNRAMVRVLNEPAFSMTSQARPA